MIVSPTTGRGLIPGAGRAVPPITAAHPAAVSMAANSKATTIQLLLFCGLVHALDGWSLDAVTGSTTAAGG
ncbi:hypothetical protein [Mycobacterium sp.]|uniref:hypothetical protein n=1 Tax=Mycobacterium sp. TaxID=1785 RepID=UPI003BA850E5